MTEPAVDETEVEKAVTGAIEDDEPLFDDEEDGQTGAVVELQPLGFKLKLDPSHEYGHNRGLSPATIA